MPETLACKPGQMHLCGKLSSSIKPQLLVFWLIIWKLRSLSAPAVQMEIKGDDAAEDLSSNGHVRLVEEALKEALACPAGPAFKPFIAALLKVANGLSLDGASQVHPFAFCGFLTLRPATSFWTHMQLHRGVTPHCIRLRSCSHPVVLNSSKLLCSSKSHILSRAGFQG